MHNPGMIRKPAFAAVLFLSCTLASAAPPLRIAIPAGSQGLTAARLWTALATEFGTHDGTGLQPVVIQDDATALAKVLGAQVTALTGPEPGPLDEHCSVVVHVPGVDAGRIQDLHRPIYHALCAYVEMSLFGKS